jgi:hypothetical protein
MMSRGRIRIIEFAVPLDDSLENVKMSKCENVKC